MREDTEKGEWRVNTEVMFSSDSTEWATPQWLFDELDREFHFTLDVCATADNAKCKRFFTKKQDALLQDWSGETCWMNPPYGRTMGQWMEKAALSNTIVVCLLPVRTDTKWFHRWVYGKAETRFIEGRLIFEGAQNSAPFPSMIVIFRPAIAYRRSA